ncbi:hypothetical protein, partial [Mycobacteroides abscessus]|uniref:hypothetical protein n=1 Tax=Mycobacteroides abscessus TaxID=36809 RepID=UPI0039EEB836
IKPSKAESQATNWRAAADRASVAIIRLLSDIIQNIGIRGGVLDQAKYAAGQHISAVAHLSRDFLIYIVLFAALLTNIQPSN